ncbi:MAG: PilZ domain-containing protein [Oleispira sp.]|nr:PilZ domain-containing protein [Oleispira sp.]MBL4880489.1 PilZ domain-containing protein [Oleispira sp.]
MTAKDRRFSDRYEGASLKLELRPRYWFGLKKEKYPALVTNFAVGGIAIITPLKLKLGQVIHVTLLSEFHNIRQLPAEVVRSDGKDMDYRYRYGLRFNLNKLPEIASNNTHFLLKQIELAIRQTLIT